VERAGLPLVLLGNNLAVPGHFELRSGAAERMEAATRHLIRRFGRAPALLGLYEGSTYNQVSLAAWSRVITDAGLPSAPFYEIQGEEIAGEAALQDIGRRAFSCGAPALICSDLSQAMTFFEMVRVGRLKRPEGFELLTFGPLMVDRITALPDWVNFMNADLLGEGRRAFELVQRALRREPVQAWSMRWSLLESKKAR
jgi:DNA-binding LacI/PurR family transcriptional regulator